MPAPLYIEIDIPTSMDLLWQRTQDPATHQRWDLRFTEIRPVPAPAGSDATAAQHFRYATRLAPGLRVGGTGVHAGDRHRPDGGCTSALRFGSTERLSLIRAGSGYWRYQPEADGVTFLTGYDYTVRWGRFGPVADRVLRPLMGWATAWSFDRLRIWLEHGVPPEVSRNHAVISSARRVALTIGAGLLGAQIADPLLTTLVVLACAAAAVLLPPGPTTPAARRCRRRPSRPTRAPAAVDRLPQTSSRSAR